MSQSTGCCEYMQKFTLKDVEYFLSLIFLLKFPNYNLDDPNLSTFNRDI